MYPLEQSERAGRWAHALGLKLMLISQWWWWWRESEKSLPAQMFTSCCQRDINISS